ncbi:MAG: hypothetical protein HYV02_04475 [Deltaproteobacteria bacterium]|nr:hypothetical protein [Deltaproteobacteria bacterium]
MATNNRRGTALTECLLLLPGLLLLCGIALGSALFSLEKMRAIYAHMMAVRAGSVAQTPDVAMEHAATLAIAIAPTVGTWQRVRPPWPVRHLPQPWGGSATGGDNPIP